MTGMGYISFEPDDMDYVRATIANAEAHGLTIVDLERTAEHAQTLAEWDAAINLLCRMTPK